MSEFWRALKLSEGMGVALPRMRSACESKRLQHGRSKQNRLQRPTTPCFTNSKQLAPENRGFTHGSLEIPDLETIIF